MPDITKRELLSGIAAGVCSGTVLGMGAYQHLSSIEPERAFAASSNLTAEDITIENEGGVVTYAQFDGATSELEVAYDNFDASVENEPDEFPVTLSLGADSTPDEWSEPNSSEPADLETVWNNMAGDGTSDSDPKIITTDHELQAMAHDLGAFYELGQNIDASETGSWYGGDGFDPVGDSTTEFTGELNGADYVVYGLTINRDAEDFVGLFGRTDTSTIENIGLVNIDITGDWDVGGLVGQNDGTISSSYATGNVNGDQYVGGLVGRHDNGSISDSYATGDVHGDSQVGGLVGRNRDSISSSYATGLVTYEGTKDHIGGFVGENEDEIEYCYWNAEVNADHDAIGTDDGGTVTELVGLQDGDMRGSSAEDEMSNLDFTSTFETVTEPMYYPRLQASPTENALRLPFESLVTGQLDAGAVPSDTVSATIGSADLHGGDLAFADHSGVPSDYTMFEPREYETERVTDLTWRVTAESNSYPDLFAEDTVVLTVTVTDTGAEATIAGGGNIVGDGG